MKGIVLRVYEWLFNAYGPQNWWPIIGIVDKQFEVCIGAILTQNTAWANVEKALANLKKINALNAGAVSSMGIEQLKGAIRPAGYFNQKAKKVKVFAEFYIGLKGKIPTRENLLGIYGIGPETADSMLLYAFNIPSFVVDAYTKRMFSKLRLVKPDWSYDQVKCFFEKNFSRDEKLYQEYHALIVRHGKKYYSKKPYGKDDPLLKLVKSG